MDSQKIDFVRKCGEILNIAKPHLISCELNLGKDIHLSDGQPPVHPDDEYVVVTCDNGHSYNILVEANSLCATASAIFSQMSHK